MELVDRKGGLGFFKATAKETALLENALKLAGNQYRYILGYDYPQTQEFKAIIRDLVPDFPLEEKIYGRYKPCFRAGAQEQHYYAEADGMTMRIESELYLHSLGRNGNNHIQLEIIFPKDVKQVFPMTITSHNYRRDHVDDLVDLLGQREKPVLPAASLLKLQDDHLYHGWKRYGLADVDRFGSILQLYERATDLVKNSSKIIGVAERELIFLRRDGLEHENLVLRDLSSERYQQELQKLLDR